MIIYKATNLINNKAYIGQTTGILQKRKMQHLRTAKHNNCPYFHRAIKKYGNENFKWETLCECDNIKELDKMEMLFISYYNTFKNGYNLDKGGHNSSGTYETRRRLAKIKKCKKHTDVHNQKISESRKGQRISEETKQKISESRKGQQLSEETKQRLLKMVKRGKDNPQSTPVIINNEYFNSMGEAKRSLNLNTGTICTRIQNNFPGYHYSKNVQLIVYNKLYSM